MNKYEQKVLSMSNDELKDILINRNLYNGWLITNARKELERRGISLTKDELNQINKIKSQRIEIAKQDKIRKQNNQEGWYIYEEYKLSEIKMKFPIIRFSQRIKKEFFTALFLSVIIGLLVTAKGQFSMDYIVAASIIAPIILLVSFFILINQNRYYLQSLIADYNKIKVSYTYFENEYDFTCDWKDVEIEKSKTFSKSPKTILILIFNNERILKIYSDINEGLTSEKLDNLIYNLRKLKGTV